MDNRNTTSANRLNLEFDSFMSQYRREGNKRHSSIFPAGRLDFDQTMETCKSDEDDGTLFNFLKKRKTDDRQSDSLISCMSKSIVEINNATTINSMSSKLSALQQQLSEERAIHERDNTALVQSKQELEAKVEALKRQLHLACTGDLENQQKLKQLTQKFTEDCKTLQMQLGQCKREKDRVRSEFTEQISSLKDEVNEVRSQLFLYRTRCTDLMSDLEKSKQPATYYKETAYRLQSELQLAIEAQSNSDRKAKEAENRYEQFKNEFSLAQAMQEDLAELRQLRRDNAILKRDCQKFKNLSENTFLLNEQREQLNHELSVLKKNHELTLIELTELKNLTTKNTGIPSSRSSGVGRSPVCEVLHFGGSDGGIGDSSSQYNVIDGLSRKCASLIYNEREMLRQLKEKAEEISALKQTHDVKLRELALQKQQELTSQKEYLLCEFEQQISLTAEKFQSEKEELLSGFAQQRTEMLNELDIRDSELLSFQTACHSLQEANVKLESLLNKPVVDLGTQTDGCVEDERPCDDMELTEATAMKLLVTELETSVSEEMEIELEAQLRKLSDELVAKNELIDVLKQKLALKLDYDPETTKIMHVEFNPLEDAHEKFTNELKHLQEENEKLKLRLAEFEKLRSVSEFEIGSLANADITMEVQQKLTEQQWQKEKEELESKVRKVEEMRDRQKRAHSDLTQRFREISAVLTGYQIKMKDGNIFQVQSVFEPHDHYFLFQRASNGELQLLDNDNVRKWTDFVETYLSTDHSFPAFLSAVTLQLYNKDTSRNSSTTSGMPGTSSGAFQ